jgi:hypothetical protein
MFYLNSLAAKSFVTDSLQHSLPIDYWSGSLNPMMMPSGAGLEGRLYSKNNQH